MKRYWQILVLVLLLIPLLGACKRKIPVTLYANYGTPCHAEPLVITALIYWPEGSSTGVLSYYGPNVRHNGFTVYIQEGAPVTVEGFGWCCCYPDNVKNTLVYGVYESLVLDTTGVFSKPHYYVAYYPGGITMYYE